MSVYGLAVLGVTKHMFFGIKIRSCCLFSPLVASNSSTKMKSLNHAIDR